MIYVFIWDFDGVIVFTPHEEAWRIAAETYGAKGFTHDFYLKHVAGRPRFEGGHAILELLGVYKAKGLVDSESKKKLLREFTNFKNKVFRELIERGVYEVNWSVIDFIIRAKREGIIQVLASASKNASPIAYKVIIKGYGVLANLFDIDVSGTGRSKEEVFKNAVEYVKENYGTIDCAIVFDDAPSGVKAGKKLGLKVVGYGGNELLEAGADLVVKEFKDLNPLVLIKELGCILK
ncbi:HAD family phosphatase [Desulfurococcaceae archaeon MEX13E-LK6-19]|nr:HAD family phosphatase [Desulfurococcaceae archaeon MEX13E-LK6-19]